MLLRLRQSGLRVVDLDLERTVDRRYRQAGGIQRFGRVVDAALAGHGLIAVESLTRRIDLVELVGQRAGKTVELVEKSAQDLIARGDQSGHLRRCLRPKASCCLGPSANVTLDAAVGALSRD